MFRISIKAKDTSPGQVFIRYFSTLLKCKAKHSIFGQLQTIRLLKNIIPDQKISEYDLDNNLKAYVYRIHSTYSTQKHNQIIKTHTYTTKNI